MGRVVAAFAYREGRRVAEIQLDDSSRWAGGKDEFVWIGFHAPTEQDLRTLQAQFGLHPLAVEDALNAHQIPKLEVYGDSLFIVLRTAWLDGEEVRLGETHVFVGATYVITVRHGSSKAHTVVRERCEANPHLLRHGVDYVLHTIVDFVVDNYFPVVQSLEAAADTIDAGITDRAFSADDIRHIYALRRQLVRLRRVTGPTAEVCSRLRTVDVKFIDKEVRPYFKDVLDHVRTVNETIDALRETLDFAFEAAHLLESARQGDVSRRFAGWAAILAVPTAIAGIYGMNFEYMPELAWHYGYFAVLGVIFGVAGLLAWRLRRTGWI